MKRTLVERVAKGLDEVVEGWTKGKLDPMVAKREARRIIAMVRRHDAKAGKR